MKFLLGKVISTDGEKHYVLGEDPDSKSASAINQ